MENNLRNTFFYIHGTLLDVKDFFKTDTAWYIFGPMYPVIALLFSITELYDGQWIFLNATILIVGFIFLSFTIFVARDHFKNNDYFKQFEIYRPNKNSSQSNDKTNNTSTTFKEIPNKDFSALIADNKNLINKCFSGMKRIALVNDDMSQSDFENLMLNCFIGSETGLTFNLEVNANQANGFTRELMKPLLERIDKGSTVNLNKIFPLLNYKKSKGYINMKVSSSSNVDRAKLTRDQKALYSDLRKM